MPIEKHSARRKTPLMSAASSPVSPHRLLRVGKSGLEAARTSEDFGALPPVRQLGRGGALAGEFERLEGDDEADDVVEPVCDPPSVRQSLVQGLTGGG